MSLKNENLMSSTSNFKNQTEAVKIVLDKTNIYSEFLNDLAISETNIKGLSIMQDT